MVRIKPLYFMLAVIVFTSYIQPTVAKSINEGLPPDETRARQVLYSADAVRWDELVENLNLKHNSPDNAVRSWWTYQNALAKFHAERCRVDREFYEAYRRNTQLQTLRLVASGEVVAEAESQRDDYCRVPTYHRTIESVTEESTTRAIVLAHVRVTTEVPGAVPTEKEIERRKEGALFRYLVEQVAPQDWKVSQVYERDFSGDFKPIYADKKGVPPTYPVYVDGRNQ